MTKWTVEAAEDLARVHLTPLGDRWRHVQGVAHAMQKIAAGIEGRDLLVSAAWLHDIGYSPSLVATQFHALDGASYLASRGVPPDLVSLVAYHTGAEYEADERGQAEQLAAFARPDQDLLDVLILADMTTSPTGSVTTTHARLDEILHRYGPKDPVHRAVARSASYLTSCATRAAARLSYPM